MLELGVPTGTINKSFDDADASGKGDLCRAGLSFLQSILRRRAPSRRFEASASLLRTLEPSSSECKLFRLDYRRAGDRRCLRLLKWKWLTFCFCQKFVLKRKGGLHAP